MKTLNSITKSPVLIEMIEQLDLPDYIEEKVNKRYESLSNWFNRENSTLKDVNIDVFPQGSFALGTTIKPIHEDEEYDLDMGCKLNIPHFKTLYSQEKLVELVGFEVEAYRKSNNIQNKIEEKRRCLCITYKDEVSFHLDIVPCIPLTGENDQQYRNILIESFNDGNFALEVAKYAVNITDNERENFKNISDDWHISNPQGYLRWFQERMKQQSLIFEQRASTEPIPQYSEKSVLQRCIQLLKRHRDNMFYFPNDSKKAAGKPISIIITTLAARAYNGETTIEEAILNILNKMPQLIANQAPRIPNPVKPEEDFADKWDDAQFQDLNLEMNFKAWLTQAKLDFSKLIQTQQLTEINSILNERFSLSINENKLVGYYNSKIEIPQKTTIHTPSIKPWCNK